MKAVPLIGIARHRLTIDGEGVTTLVAFHGCPLRCKYCLNPTSLQPNGVWESYNCNQLYEEVRKDELYFLASCGGVTFGGGEPLLQSEFIRQFRQLCGPEWRITVETSLNVPQQNVEELISIIDNYIIDIKDMNSISFASAICRRISFKILQVCFPLAMALIIRGFIGESVELGDSHFFQKFYALVNILLRIIGRDEWCPNNDLLGFVFPD